MAELKGKTIYEVNSRQYTELGTFNAFKAHLPRLRNMGIDILWFMPIYPISKEKRKGTLGSYYAISNYQGINPEFGNLEDFKSLVHEAHQLGFKVILDWVANHTGVDHIWTKSNKEFYILNVQGHFTERNGWDDVIDLNYQNEAMRKEMIRCMKYWITETGIDGFRCDMAMLVPLDFWKQVKNELDEKGRLIWLGECENQEYFEAFDTLYAWEWMHSCQSMARQILDRNHLQILLEKYLAKTPDAKSFLYFTSNHDENSWNGTEYERYGKYTHIFAAINFLVNKGTPLIYSGQEKPLQKRLLFFDKDTIEWEGEIALQDFYKTLISVNKYVSNQDIMEINTLVDHPYIFTLQLLSSGRTTELLFIANLGEYYTESIIKSDTIVKNTHFNVFTNELVLLDNNPTLALHAGEFRIYWSENKKGATFQ